MENKPLIHHWISISILSEIMQKSPAKIRKIYKSIIQDECIPLIEIPINLQNIYVKDYLLRDRMIDFSFLDAIKDYSFSTPLKNPDVQFLFREMAMMRKAFEITRTFSASGNVTGHLRELASEYHISYSTLARRRSLYMNSTPLYRALSHSASTEDTRDRYRPCCLYCRDLIIFLHEKPGKISAAKIFRDIRDAKPFSCKKCPYHPDVKAKPHNKKDYIPFATCKRNSEFMVKPNCDDTVCSVIRNIPEQQDVLAWAGVRSWATKFHYTPAREKSGLVNQCWIADHKKCDIWVRTKLLPDGTWEIKRPWITAIIDSATNVMVSYVLSLNPNSDCIAECFARACAFTVDTPYSGICDYFYIDNGKDFRSKKLNGLPNSEEDHLYLNKDFGESGILEWFGIKVIHALPYRGCSKTIESIWGTIDDEWFRELPGYCGSRPSERPYILDEQIKKNELYTFEQFADYFADTIYPEYNNFSVTKESPNELYSRLPKTSSFVPSWRTLSVLKSVTGERVIRSKGIQFGNNKFYWCSELGPLIEKEKSTKYRIFAFDTPFNRNISVVYDHQYIGEAHLIEKLNVVEKKRYKVIQHLMEQQAQHRFYSKRLEQLHSLVFQSDILDEVCSIPPIDNIHYGQAIDTERDKNEATDDNAIPEELKAQAESYANNFLNPDDHPAGSGQLSQTFRELGRQVRQQMKGEKKP